MHHYPETILLIERSPFQTRLIKKLLQTALPHSCQILNVRSLADAVKQLEQQPVDIILTDLNLPDYLPEKIVCFLNKHVPEMPIVIITGDSNEETAIRSLQQGAQDYLIKKEMTGPLLIKMLGYAIERKRIQLELQRSLQLIHEQNTQMRDELELAAQTQNYILSGVTHPTFLQTTFYYHPFGTISGDTYDIRLNREGAIVVFLGDGTGHGIPASLITMMVHMGLKTINMSLPVSEIMNQLNQHMGTCLPPDQFMTGIFVRISANGNMEICNAGHPTLVSLPANSQNELCLFNADGPPLGMIEDVQYNERTHHLDPGDRFFMFTDGLTEWANPDAVLFSEEQVMSCLLHHRHENLNAMMSGLLNAAQEFAEGVVCNDDMTILGFEFAGE
ncbi:MAG: fused response regulator/phosphatase [SAR324 cluster bacterium]|nr:fused response regulator/phosphatase [SAR324 cluster bacterium]